MKSLFSVSIISVMVFEVIGGSAFITTVNNGIPQVTEKMNNNDAEMLNPEKCPKDMALAPVDDDNSINWICDCNIPSFLYFLEDDSCYQAYKQGPCSPEYYLILPPGEDLAKCEKNPCHEDGLVPYKGTCARLFERGGSCYLRFYLTVNPETFQLTCSIHKFNIIKAPEIKCPRGTRRNALGACKKEFK